MRVAAAEFEHDIDPEPHPCNCDEVRYQNQNFFASFTKGLKKINKFGEVDPDAYCALLAALESGKPNDFEKIPLGCTGAHKHPPGKVKLGDPLADHGKQNNEHGDCPQYRRHEF